MVPSHSSTPTPHISWGVQAAFVGLFTIFFLGIPYLLHVLHGDYYLFYRDDFQTEYMPAFHEIARLLKIGQFPLITDRLWDGGALLVNYKFGILNPVCLFLIWIISFIPDLGQAAALYVIAHYAIYSSGIYYLCKQLNYKTGPALVATSVAASSFWLLYWGGITWIAALVSLAWLPWGLATLVVVYRNPHWLPLGSLAVAMPLVSGWPTTTLSVMIIFVLIALGALQRCYLEIRASGYTTCKDVILRYLPFSSSSLRSSPPHYVTQDGWLEGRRLLLVCVCGVGGFLLAMPALLPLFFYISEESTRWVGLDTTWSVNLENLLTLNLPKLTILWNVFGKTEFVVLNYAYTGWFLTILFFSVEWKKLNRPTTKCFLILLAVFTALCMIPQFWQFRYNFRFLPFWHLALGLLAGWVLNQELRHVRLTWRGITLGLGVPFFLAFCHMPTYWYGNPSFPFFLAILVIMVAALQREGKTGHLVFVFGQVFFLFYALMIFRNDQLPLWPGPTQLAKQEASNGNEIFLYSMNPPVSSISQEEAGDAFFWNHIMYGNSGLFYGRTTINGYSNLLTRGFTKNFCFDYIGQSCPEISDKLMALDEMTHLPFLDLLKVQRVTSLDTYTHDFETASGTLWQKDTSSTSYTSFTRSSKLADLPGSISWIEHPMAITLVSQTAREESYTISNPGTDNQILFARAWYPGMSAELNGEKILLTPYRDLLPLLRLPQGTQGKLLLKYWPKGLTSGLILALCGLLASLILGFRFKDQPTIK